MYVNGAIPPKAAKLVRTNQQTQSNPAACNMDCLPISLSLSPSLPRSLARSLAAVTRDGQSRPGCQWQLSRRTRGCGLPNGDLAVAKAAGVGGVMVEPVPDHSNT
jgi:hypothetical protein